MLQTTFRKKLIAKFSNKFKKTYFLWPIFGQFEKIWLSCATPHEPLIPCWVSAKTNKAIPRKLPNGRTERRKDRKTLIHRAKSKSWVQKANILKYSNTEYIPIKILLWWSTQSWRERRKTETNHLKHQKTCKCKFKDRDLSTFLSNKSQKSNIWQYL